MDWPRLVAQLEEQPYGTRLAAVLGIAALVGLLDAVTGEAFALTLLYPPVVGLTVWLFGMQAGVGLSAILALFWLLAVHEKYGPSPFSAAALWEMIVLAVVLSMFAFVTDRWRKAARGERSLASHDALTGVGNRAFFMERAAAEINRGRRGDRPLTAVFIDCDRFKAVNDTRGHLAGDECLKAIAATLQSKTRSYDVVARMGGDEFALLLPETDAEAARAVIKRLHAGLGKAMKAKNWPVTFSIGVATFLRAPETPDELIRAADELMYAAKRAGSGGVQHETIGPKAAS